MHPVSRDAKLWQAKNYTQALKEQRSILSHGGHGTEYSPPVTRGEDMFEDGRSSGAALTNTSLVPRC